MRTVSLDSFDIKPLSGKKNKGKKITSELNEMSKKIENKKDKIISQKNILKKEEYEKLLKSYDEEVKKFNNFRKKKK